MSELSSDRKISFKIKVFNIKSEDSNASKKIKNFKSKSVNILTEEEKIGNMNINLNSKMNYSNNKNSEMSEDIKSSSEKEEEQKKEKEKEDSKSPKKNSVEMNEIFIYKDGIKEMNEYCLICENQLTMEELINNFIECFHGFCDSCYYDYLKEKINNNNVENIKCPQKDCNIVLFDNFIENHLLDDIPLLEKYIKFKERKQLSKDPNIQLCPYPNCESYAVKNDKNLKVTCLKGHKFCFNCLKNWHGNEKCKLENDSKFEDWKNSKKVKRCPNCKYFVEKNEGCNHMTCSNCKYEWCWLCLQESLPGHYNAGGKCEGLQFSNCQCLSNRFCFFLYKFIFHILGILKLICLFPIVFYLFVFEKIKDINYDVYSIITAFITFYFCLFLFVHAICLMFIISTIMIFCCPLKRKITELFNHTL